MINNVGDNITSWYCHDMGPYTWKASLTVFVNIGYFRIILHDYGSAIERWSRNQVDALVSFGFGKTITLPIKSLG